MALRFRVWTSKVPYSLRTRCTLSTRACAILTCAKLYAHAHLTENFWTFWESKWEIETEIEIVMEIVFGNRNRNRFLEIEIDFWKSKSFLEIEIEIVFWKSFFGNRNRNRFLEIEFVFWKSNSFFGKPIRSRLLKKNWRMRIDYSTSLVHTLNVCACSYRIQYGAYT